MLQIRLPCCFMALRFQTVRTCARTHNIQVVRGVVDFSTTGSPPTAASATPAVAGAATANSNAAAAEDRRCCSICLEPYAGEPAAALKLPRVLPCGHSFCEGCITQILRKLPAANEEAHKTITCPKCRDAVAVPRGQARRLPTNYDLID